MQLYQKLDRRHKLFGKFNYKLSLSQFHHFTNAQSLRSFVGNEAIIKWCEDQFGEHRTMVHTPIAGQPGVSAVSWTFSDRWRVAKGAYQSKHLYLQDEEDLAYFLLKWTK